MAGTPGAIADRGDQPTVPPSDDTERVLAWLGTPKASVTPSGMSASELRYNRAAYKERRRELAEDWTALILEGADTAESLCEGRRRRVER